MIIKSSFSKVMLFATLSVFLIMGTYAGPPDQDQRALEKAKKDWERNSNGFSSYSYYTRRSCFCLPDYTQEMFVNVTNKEIVSADYADPNYDSSLTEDQRKGTTTTVDGLFDMIQGGINGKVATLTVNYERIGYPSYVFIDYSEMIADEEYIVTVTRPLMFYN